MKPAYRDLITVTNRGNQRTKRNTSVSLQTRTVNLTSRTALGPR
jgi:hypothetical protein